MAAPKWTGFLQRGQTRKPVSNFTTEGGGIRGGANPACASSSEPVATTWSPVAVEIGPSERGTFSTCRLLHTLSWARSSASSSSVRASEPLCVGCLADGVVEAALWEVGTGTTRPQSG